MNENKYFRIIQKTDREGKTIFEVHGTENKFNVLVNYWYEYTKENKTLEEAFDHIKALHKWGVEKKEVVFKGTVNACPK